MDETEETQGLSQSEIDAMLEAMGRPSAKQIDSAVEEVRRQIALEDILMLLIEAVQQIVRAFFDFLLRTEAPTLMHRPERDEGDDR